MIRSYRTRDLEAFHRDGVTPRAWRAIAKAALRKLDMLDAAQTLNDMRSPPGNRLESLKGRQGGPAQYPDQRPVSDLFCLDEQGPERVEIVHYH
ncbi:MAG: type II toxin-antitoxin system RelE/ParE family toxin [Terricaulis sp.]